MCVCEHAHFGIQRSHYEYQFFFVLQRGYPASWSTLLIPRTCDIPLHYTPYNYQEIIPFTKNQLAVIKGVHRSHKKNQLAANPDHMLVSAIFEE